MKQAKQTPFLLRSIRPNKKNPRTISDSALQKLAHSISQFPRMMELRPMVVDKDGNILGGNMRYRAITEVLKMKEVPQSWVVRAEDLDENQRRRFVVSDNAPEGASGDWDMRELLQSYSEQELKEYGFDAKNMQEWRDYYREIDDQEGQQRAEQEQQFEEMSERIGLTTHIASHDYCALATAKDLIRGKCPYKCAYCYVLNSPVPTSATPFLLDINKTIEDLTALPEGRPWRTGVCIEPTLSKQGLESLAHVIKVTSKRKQVCMVMTKNPLACLDLIDTHGVDPKFLMVKPAFSCPDYASVLEPNAPSVDQRLRGIKELRVRNVTVILRFCPLLFGHYGGIDVVTRKCSEWGVKRCVIEPLRWSRTWTNEHVLAAFKKVGLDIDQYFQKWAHGKYAGVYHWYAYDERLVIAELRKFITRYVHKNKMRFGFCSGLFINASAALNEGAWCCETTEHAHDNVDRDCLACMIGSGRTSELVCQYLAPAIKPDMQFAGHPQDYADLRARQIRVVAWTQAVTFPDGVHADRYSPRVGEQSTTKDPSLTK